MGLQRWMSARLWHKQMERKGLFWIRNRRDEVWHNIESWLFHCEINN